MVQIKVFKWNVPVPVPVILDGGKHGSLRIKGETFRDKNQIQCTLYFDYGDLRITLWKASQHLPEIEFQLLAEEIWSKLNGDGAFEDLIRRPLDYQSCSRRTERYNGDSISYDEFRRASLGMAPPPTPRGEE